LDIVDVVSVCVDEPRAALSIVFLSQIIDLLICYQSK